MKLDFDKEIDSLLRNHPQAARKRGAMADAAPDFAHRDVGETQRAMTAHLDVDELSAYAENALPAATRGRYLSHLADCEMCRKHATSIAMAADVAGALERSASAARPHEETSAVPSGWRAVLASFFKPRAFRYALPVLALLVTGTMIFMATLTFQREMTPPALRIATEDAPREDATSYEERAASKENDNGAGQAVVSAPPAAVNQEAPRESGAIDSLRRIDESKKTEAIARAAKDDAAAVDAPAVSGVANSSVSQPPAPQTAATSTVETRRLQSRTEVESLRVEGRSATPQPAASPVKEITKGADKNEARESRAEDVAITSGNNVVNAPPARRERSDVPRDELAAAEKQNRKVEEVIVARPAAPKARAKSEASGASVRNRQSAGRATSDSALESSVETRSVAGRRFRRLGGAAWVDAEYKSSASLTNVTRGSEQYRALVADEPELRRVAEQLGGEVIVVWKNRAYRIR
ncbi:MAG TPA: hypothetical protein VM943_11405 [Pyrinomonadaceae bacterium]|nr:hypothetical protein [Pyrinomonadaceae bacterium]